MAAIGRYNSLQIVKHTGFGLYLDGGPDGEILLPNRYIPKDVPTEVDDWLNVFVYLDSEDKLIATTEKPRVQVGEFASLKVAEINRVGLFLDWGCPRICYCRTRRRSGRCKSATTVWSTCTLTSAPVASPPPHGWIAIWTRRRRATGWATRWTC